MTKSEYLTAVRNCKCVICDSVGLIQQGPTYAHHVESVRDEWSDYAAVALCYPHHQGTEGVHGLSRRTFSMRYRLSDIDMIARTVAQVVKGMR